MRFKVGCDDQTISRNLEGGNVLDYMDVVETPTPNDSLTSEGDDGSRHEPQIAYRYHA